jgi:hypothetical protein
LKEGLLLLLVVLLAAQEAYSIAWVPDDGKLIRREGYLYNYYPYSYLRSKLHEGEDENDLRINLGGFKSLGNIYYEYGLKQDDSVYCNVAFRYELHRITIEEGLFNKTQTSFPDSSVDLEVGVKKQIVNTNNPWSNDVVTLLLGVAPGSIYMATEKNSLFSRNNSYLISGISYGKSFFSEYRGFAELSFTDKIYFHDNIKEFIFNAAIGLKSQDNCEFSVGIQATTGNIPYKSRSLETMYNKLKHGLDETLQKNTVLEHQLEQFLLPKKVRKKAELYINNSYNISDEKQITLGFATEMPLNKGVWGVKLEFAVFR